MEGHSEQHWRVQQSMPMPQKQAPVRTTGQPLTGKRTPAIFIHAGAGYHSQANEKVHLKACENAATMGMKFLKRGSTAAEAVVAAIKVLEDREITNAGYGSNLCIDGTVECDATIVDHLGRSGACGAVSNIRNPINLAKIILDNSLKPLSLGRVPPNLLVGEGAKQFAREHGVDIVPNEDLISKNAGDRFMRWQADLSRAAEPTPTRSNAEIESYTIETAIVGLKMGNALQPDHANAVATGLWNEGQPDSPSCAVPGNDATGVVSLPAASHDRVAGGLVKFLEKTERVPRAKRARHETRSEDAPSRSAEFHAVYDAVYDASSTRPSGSRAAHLGTQPPPDQPLPAGEPRTNSTHIHLASVKRGLNGQSSSELHSSGAHGPKRYFGQFGVDGEDKITDTVGAIAIDEQGRIAAGSSSGGIGMKHRGRLGPAALVRVGTSVIPAHPLDPEGVSVAVVASGTGEQMATAMASQKCAERILRSTRQGTAGEDVVDEDELEILKSFITKDFMEHPGVENRLSTGALGVLAVKKYDEGCYMYFAHNTESFALASMAATDRTPLCVMSRGAENSSSTMGARRVRLVTHSPAGGY